MDAHRGVVVEEMFEACVPPRNRDAGDMLLLCLRQPSAHPPPACSSAWLPASARALAVARCSAALPAFTGLHRGLSRGRGASSASSGGRGAAAWSRPSRPLRPLARQPRGGPLLDRVLRGAAAFSSVAFRAPLGPPWPQLRPLPRPPPPLPTATAMAAVATALATTTAAAATAALATAATAAPASTGPVYGPDR